MRRLRENMGEECRLLVVIRPVAGVSVSAAVGFENNKGKRGAAAEGCGPVAGGAVRNGVGCCRIVIIVRKKDGWPLGCVGRPPKAPGGTVSAAVRL